jgi:hypothetical protein
MSLTNCPCGVICEPASKRLENYLPHIIYLIRFFKGGKMKKSFLGAWVFLGILVSWGFAAKSDLSFCYLGVLADKYPVQLIRSELGRAGVNILDLKDGIILFETSGRTRITPFLKRLPFLKKVYTDGKAVLKDQRLKSLKDQRIPRKFAALSARNRRQLMEVTSATLSPSAENSQSLSQQGSKEAERTRMLRKQAGSLDSLLAIDRAIKSRALTRHKISPLQADDPYEDNDTMETAAAMTPGTYSNLQSLDDDWYKVNIPAGQDLIVTINFDSANGNLDLYLYDPDGNYLDSDYGLKDSKTVSAGNLAAGWYYIYVPSWDEANSYSMEITAANGLLGGISGRVTDESSNGIANVDVSVMDLDGYSAGWASTDSSGNYSVQGLIPGDYKVYFGTSNAGNYLPEYYNNKASFETADPITTTAGQTTSGINAQLTTGGSIKGRVTDSQGNGIEWVNIYAYDQYGYIAGNAYSDANGDYDVLWMTTGSYKVAFDAYSTSYLDKWYNDKNSFETADPVSVTTGQETSGINAELILGGSISGRVTDDQSGGGIGDVYVDAYDLDQNWISESWSDWDGNFLITRLAGGDFKVLFDPTSYSGNYIVQWYNNKKTFGSADPVTVILGQTTTEINAELKEGGMIYGQVSDAYGNGLDYASVTVYDTNRNWLGGESTDSDGSYTIQGLPSGKYKVHFNAWGNYVPEWYNNRVSYETADKVTVISGEATWGINARLADGGIISGQVTDTSGNGVPYAGVEIYDLKQNYTGYGSTDSNGDYSVDGLATGSYKAYFSDYGSDYVSEWYNDKRSFASGNSIKVTAKRTTSGIDAELATGGGITGTVTDGSGNPLKEVRAQVYDLNFNQISIVWTDANGEYFAGGVPEGSVKIFFSAILAGNDYCPEWYSDKSTFTEADPVSILSGQVTTDINAQLSEGGSISGRVTNGSGAGISDIYVIVFEPSNENLAISYGKSNSSGDYTVPGILSGNFKVYFDAEFTDYLSEWYDNKKSFGAADLVSVTAGQTTTGIDAVLEQSHSFLITNPTSATAWTRGEAVAITWTSTGSVARVNIFLNRGLGKVKTIALGTANTGLKNWIVPLDLGQASNYRVVIEDAAATSAVGFSEPFTINQSATLTAPSLVSPVDGATNQPTTLSFQWQDTNSSPQELKYQIRIKPAGGAYTLLNSTKDATSYLLTLTKANKAYSWNVRAIGNGSTIKNSAWANGGVDWSFTTSAPVTLNPPDLVAPADNATDQPLNVTLQWTDTNTMFQEKGYQIRIKPAGGAYTNVITAKDAISYLKKGLAKNKIYYWNVRAKGTGTSTKDSSWANSGVDWKFTTIK